MRGSRRTSTARRTVPLLPAAAAAGGHVPVRELPPQHQVAPRVRLIVLLALIPHVRPQLLDVLCTRNEATQRGFAEFGGCTAASHGGFLPTGETAAFLLAGDDLAARFDTMRLFDADEFLARQNVLHLAPVGPGESQLAGAADDRRGFPAALHQRRAAQARRSAAISRRA